MQKLLLVLFLLVSIFPLKAEILINARVIPWKKIDKVEHIQIIIASKKDTLFNESFKHEEIKHIGGEYPRNLIDLKLEGYYNEITFQVVCKYIGSPYLGGAKISTRIVGKEKRMELEVHFQKQYNERTGSRTREFISELILKKIYHCPEEIKLIRAWQPKMEHSPKYFVTNYTRFLLYGQSGDSNFEGMLYQKIDGKWKQVPTGGYDPLNEPFKPLYSNNHVTSFIRDHREAKLTYTFREKGAFKYKVYLGFSNYEQSTAYGDLPYYSELQGKRYYSKTATKIYEYFELSDVFEVK